jgi:DNA primase large subunit
MPLPIVFLETERDIDRLTELLNSGEAGAKYDEDMETRILKKFDYSGIKEKVEILKKVSVDFDTAITFKHKMRPKSVRYPRDLAYNFVWDAYSRRNDVVHRGQLPLKRSSDLEAISELFSELMMNIALIMRDGPYGLPTDLDMMLSGSGSIDASPIRGTTENYRCSIHCRKMMNCWRTFRRAGLN